MAKSRNIVGAALTVLINGRVIGEVTSFSFQSMTPHKETAGLDQLTPFEMSPRECKVTGTMGVLRRQATGGLEGRGIVAPFERISEQRFFSILIIDRRNQATFFRADDCIVRQQQWEVAARGRVAGTFSFSGLSWINEVDID